MEPLSTPQNLIYDVKHSKQHFPIYSRYYCLPLTLPMGFAEHTLGNVALRASTLIQKIF